MPGGIAPTGSKSPRLNFTVLCVSLLASLGGFLFGYDIGYIGPIESFPGFQKSVNGNQILTSYDRGFITAIFSLGAVGASFPLVSAYLSDHFGRRRTIMFATVVFIIGAALQATANSMVQILFGRFMSGLAVGGLSNAVPMYQSEVAPQEWRGMLCSTYQWCITIGILVSYFVDSHVNPNDSRGWRIAIWAQVVPASVLLVGMMFAPFSPRWLMLCGRTEEANRTLRLLRGSEEEADREAREILTSLESNKGVASLTDVFGTRFSSRLVGVGMIVMLLQQLCGMNAFMYYGTVIFKGLQLSPSIFNPVMGAVNVICTIPGLLLVDRVGRVKLLQWSGTGMFLACIGCSACLAQFPVECMGHGGCGADAMAHHPHAAHGFVLSMFVFIGSFAFGWGPVAWVYCAEIFPLRLRSMALGVVTCTCWTGNYLVAYFTPVMLEMLHFWTFLIFAFFCGLGLLLSLWLPETRGVPLESIPQLFEAKVDARMDECQSPLEPSKGKSAGNGGYSSMS